MDEQVQPPPTQEPSQFASGDDTVQQRTQMVRGTQNFLRLMIGGFAKIFGEIMSMIFRR